MMKVKDIERATRTIEAFNMMAIVLPIYDDEARRVFRASFKVDMADLIPHFFKSLALECIRRPEGFQEYLTYVKRLIEYTEGKGKAIPLPKDADDHTEAYFRDAREAAEKMLRAWAVRQA